jgi:hypothetical protein
MDYVTVPVLTIPPIVIVLLVRALLVYFFSR